MSVAIITSAEALRSRIKAWRREGAVIGLVPTMGALHDGHLSLVTEARKNCDRVIVSLFVNPRQFDNPADLAAYPRTEAQDAQMLVPYAVDALFVPDAADVYPASHDTAIGVGALSTTLEGAHRPGHFDGMATIVTMLFNMTGADRAYFGEKDWQQLQIIRRIAHDLHMPVEIVACPTIREADGLALSSRNRRMTPDQRAIAALLPRGMKAAIRAIEAGKSVITELTLLQKSLAEAGFGTIDYLELRDQETLGPPRAGHPARLFAAIRLGDIRLIDNMPVALP